MKPRFPILLITLTTVLAFGILLPGLGFYWDDWSMISAWRALGGKGVWELLGDPFRHRPLSGWTSLLFGPLASSCPLAWQLLSLTLRWACAITFWAILRRLWPARPRLAMFSALLFLVYPIFLQQPISVAYHQHWLTYLLFLLSLLMMLHAQNAARRNHILLTLAALITQALHLTIFEYFVGTEFIRPVLLFLLLPASLPLLQQLRLTLLRWFPYLLINGAFILWRLSISIAVPSDGNRPSLLFDLLHQPLSTLLHLAKLASTDVLHMLVLDWLPTLQIAPWWVSLISLALAGLLFWQLSHLPSPSVHQRGELWQATLIGLLFIVLGSLPIWITDRVSWRGFFSNRFGLPATLGTALLWATALTALPFQRSKIVPLLAALLIGLASGQQLRTALPYQTAWQQQKQYTWQLFWRAPTILPNTAILSADSIFPGIRRTFALNLTYNQPRGSKQLPLWFYLLNDSLAEEISQFGAQEENYLGYTFQSQAEDVLLVVYNPQDGRCLWIPSPADADLPDLSPTIQAALPLSNLARIQSQSNGSPPVEIFGPPPLPTWCYYFQKASLAGQQGDWQTVAQLADQASALTHHPAALYEWLPFLEGYARVGRINEAHTLTQTILQANPNYQTALCRIWSTLPNQAPPDLTCPAPVTP
jgi:hypothetical protein